MEKIYNNFTLAVALRGLGDLKRAEKYVEKLNEGLKKRNEEFHLSAYSLVIYHSIFNETDEVDKLINIINKKKDEDISIMLLSLSASMPYLYTKKEKYLDMALEGFHKAKNDLKVEIGINLMNLIDKPSVVFNIINEITAENQFLYYYIDKFISTLGRVYANTKDNRILDMMRNRVFSNFILDFLLNMAGHSLSKKLRITLSFW